MPFLQVVDIREQIICMEHTKMHKIQLKLKDGLKLKHQYCWVKQQLATLQVM